MTDLILQYLNTLVSTVGTIERPYCLVERRSGSDGTTMPYEYVGGGNFKPVEVDGGSVSYFRLRAARTLETVDGRTAEKPIQATYPLRFVAMIRRDDNNPEVYSQDVANILTGTNQDLRTILGANRAVITVTSIETDTPKIWQEEFTTPITEPKYSRSMVMIDLTVTVVATRSCWDDCADYPDILQMFPWCNPATLERLTPEQVTCLEGELCVPLCDQLADVLPEDVVADVFDCLTLAAQTELLDSECVIPPCADATIEINSTAFGTVASGGTVDIPVINGGSNPVGALQGSNWVIGNNATFINSVQVTDQEAEIDANIAVELDGNPSGSWNAGTQTWEVTSSPCADATVTINGASLGATGDIPSGGSEDLDVLQGGSAVGSWNGSAWIIPTCPAAASLSIALSDSTPNFGDAVTITATPTSITPTIYTFIVPNDFGGYTRITQVSNIYVWTAVYTGLLTLTVDATDGVSVVANDASVTVSWSFNQAISLNGTTQYITAVQEGAFGVSSATKWLLSFWINADSFTNNPIVFSYNNFWFVQIRATDVRLRFDSSGSGKTYAQTFVAGQWYHVVVQRTGAGDNASVYVNAVQRTTTAGTVGSDSVSTDLLQIGRYSGGAGFEFDGKTDSIVFQRGYNASLAQIQAYYNSGTGAHQSVLGFTNLEHSLLLDGNTTNSGLSPYTFIAVNSPTYVAH